MKRTTISLPDDVAAALDREASRRHVPVSQVAREAIEARLGLADNGPRKLPFAGLYESGLPGIARHDEDYLREHWPDAIARDR
ncbi:MAG TPA: CopG family transcriptional regulator [Candidatus Limnocylindria bacterium]